MKLLQQLTEVMNLDPDERRIALAREQKRLKRWGEDERRSREFLRSDQYRKKIELAHKKRQQLEAQKRAEHERRMKYDPKYRASEERQNRQSAEAWRSYGEARRKKDPSIMGIGSGGNRNWTGD